MKRERVPNISNICFLSSSFNRRIAIPENIAKVIIWSIFPSENDCIILTGKNPKITLLTVGAPFSTIPLTSVITNPTPGLITRAENNPIPAATNVVAKKITTSFTPIFPRRLKSPIPATAKTTLAKIRGTTDILNNLKKTSPITAIAVIFGPITSPAIAPRIIPINILLANPIFFFNIIIPPLKIKQYMKDCYSWHFAT